MANELSVEGIKKGIIDKIANNMEILKYLEVDKCEGIKLDKLNDSFIFAYDVPDMSGNYISVEVAEYEYSQTGIRDREKYVISIKVGLNRKNNLDKIMVIVKDIVLKLYPNIRSIRNEPFCAKAYSYTGEYDTINRMITFEIE